MQHAPTVSVVMPAFNAEQYIEFSIASVLEQTFSNFEILVVDDCSTDSTCDIVSKLLEGDPRVQLLRLDRNYGAPAGPRNIGIRAAKGAWVAFIDADDVWHPGKLEAQMDALVSTNARFCSTQMNDFVSEDDLVLCAPDASDFERVGFWKQLVKFRTPTSSVVASRDLLLRHPFNEDLRYKAREDLDCWLKCHEEIRSSIKLRQPLLGYRITPGQISGRKWQMFQRHLFVLRRYRFFSGKGLGPLALLFTISHFVLAMYYRTLKKGL